MRAASAGLITALGTGQKFLLADLYTFTLVGGTVVRYATGDSVNGLGTVSDGTNSFDASAVVIERGKIKTVIGVEVDTLELTVHAQIGHLLGGVPWLTACRRGVLDGARLKFETLFMTTAGDTSLGTIVRFSGRVEDLSDIGRTSVRMRVVSDLALLNTRLPRHLFQPGCLNTLFDAGCGLTKASFAQTGSVGSGSTASIINVTLTQPTGYFNLGTIVFTSGALNGLTATIRSYVSGTNIVLVNPLPAAPATSDTFTAYPGCPKTMGACSNTNAAVSAPFNNLANFRGFPFVPVPESIL